MLTSENRCKDLLINVTRYKRHNFLDISRAVTNFKYHLISTGGNLKVNTKMMTGNIRETSMTEVVEEEH